MSEPARHQVLVEYPGAEHSLYEVVDDEDSAQAEGLAVLHEPRAQHLGEVGVEQADGERGQRRAHHGPVVHPRVTLIVHDVMVLVYDGVDEGGHLCGSCYR